MRHTAKGIFLSSQQNKPNFRNNEDSESDYNPSSNDIGEEDLLDDDNVQVQINSSIY